MKNPFVFFDLGNVLVNFDHQIAVQKLAALAGRPEDLVRTSVFGSDLQNQYESGRVSCQVFAERINGALHTQLADAEILDAVSAIFTLNESILPVLERLQASGVPRGLLSNTCPAHWSWILRQGWSIPGRWFEFHVLSYEVQSMKPDTAIYQVSEQRSGRPPAELFFTDDRFENVEAARRRGWEAHLYQAVDPLLEHLDRWLGRAG